MFQEQKESEYVDAGKLWKEIKDWRKHWKLSRFFYVLILGLATSLFDSGTDFYFAWSVPEACGLDKPECSEHTFDLARVSSPCGRYPFKNIERATYTIIAFPGFILGFCGLQSLIAALINKCWRGEINGNVHVLAGAFAAALQFFLLAGLWSVLVFLRYWACDLPDLAEGYDRVLQGMAYLSASLIVGVQCLGTFCHGPQSRRLVFRAKETETKFEAALQLGLLARIYLSSGSGTFEGLLSAISSIVIIGKNGVQNFLQRHQEKLSEASLLGKICVATSVLPVFLLAAIFKLGAGANNEVWKKSTIAVVLLSSLALPILIILLLKMCNLFKDLPLTSLSEWILSELVSFHLWPKGRTGKRIGLTMTVFTFLLYASPGPFLIASPEPTISTNYWVIERNNTDYTQWVSKTSDRLQVASISFLTIGFIAFVLAICLILFEDQWVSKIVFRFPKQPKQEEKASKGPPATEAEIESKKNTKLPREDHEGG